MNEHLKHGGEEAIDRTNKEAEAAEEERLERFRRKIFVAVSSDVSPEAQDYAKGEKLRQLDHEYGVGTYDIEFVDPEKLGKVTGIVIEEV